MHKPLARKKVQDCNYVFGSSMTFQRGKGWICESRCQVSDHLHVLAGFFFWPWIVPRLSSLLSVILSVYILPLFHSLQSSFNIDRVNNIIVFTETFQCWENNNEILDSMQILIMFISKFKPAHLSVTTIHTEHKLVKLILRFRVSNLFWTRN